MNEKTAHHKRVWKLRKKIAKDLVAFYHSLPASYRERVEEEIRYAGIEEDKSLFCATLIVAFWIPAIINLLFLVFVIHAPIWMALIPTTILMLVGFFSPYLVFMNVAEARRKRMELVLPDILLLIASNIKSGLTIDRAILFAARPEFGELSKEFKKVAFEIYGGEEIGNAFTKLTRRIKSVILERTVKLLIEGLRAGGAVASLLEETANDIRNTEVLQREIRSSVMMYVMFIFIAGVIAAPFLFAVSNVLVESTAVMWGGLNIEGEAAQFLSGGLIALRPTQINASTFNYFSIISLFITLFFASLLISIIQTGTTKNALKYLPAFMIIAYAVYFGAKKMLMKIFSALIV